MRKHVSWHCAQKYFYLAASSLLLAALPACAKTVTEPKLGPNLAKNAGFENGSSNWNIPQGTAKVVSDEAHSGTHSLYYSNTDAKQYKLFSQHVNVKPGQHIRFSVWIKGKDVGKKGSSEGASLFMQSSGASGYVGGSFPSRLTGTFDWKQVTGEYTVLKEATSTSVGVYLRKGVTGTVWFDDVEVRLVHPPSFKSFLTYPNYRGTALQGSAVPWKYQVQISKQDNWKNAPVIITTSLTDAAGKVLLTDTAKTNPAQKSLEVTIHPPKNLPAGNYTLKQTITDPNGEQALQNEDAIHVVKKMPGVYVDPQGFTVVNGKRFFPFGFYIGGGTSDNENLQRIAKGGFNTVLSYAYGARSDAKTYMKNARQNGLKVIYSVKDMYPGKHGYGDNAFDVAAKYIKLVRDEPALLAWYTNDELGSEWLPQMEKTYNLIKQLDPNHPAYQVQNKVQELENDFAVTDVLGSDPYPVGGSNLSNTSRRTQITVGVAQSAKSVWMVPQSMDWAVYHADRKQHPPTLDEMRNQAYQSIINGATGLIYYSYYDMMYEKYPRGKSTTNMDLFNRRWADCTRLASEINGVIPVILSDKKVALHLPENADVQAAAWQDGNRLLILLANPYYEQKSITFEVPQGWNIKKADQGEIKSTFAAGKVTFTLPSVGSGVFCLER